ncbi:MAG: hypothetical protein IKO02_04275 [Lentisphaeria bacterium]|nr:hypothetical protein [Lentisphaeria bacterium]
MTEEEQAAVNAENQSENTVPETPAAEKQSEPAAAAEADATETDANNFGEDASDNFGGEAEAAAGFEDNFGLGE